jgi:dihydropyrimidine dehydrogenase (NAD+) subunit PreA
MVQQVAGDAEGSLPISGIGGIATWRDAAEFFLLGCGTVQVCTAAMHYGYRIVEDMIEGLEGWMREKGFASIEDFRGLSLPRVTEWKHLNLNYKMVARIDETKCIGCDLCYIACWDGAHQCIHRDRVSGPVDGPVELHSTPASIEAATRASITVTPIPKLDAHARNLAKNVTPSERIPRVDETECVGCNLCSLVCPVEECITMVEVPTGLAPETWEERTRGKECAPPAMHG